MDTNEAATDEANQQQESESATQQQPEQQQQQQQIPPTLSPFGMCYNLSTVKNINYLSMKIFCI